MKLNIDKTVACPVCQEDHFPEGYDLNNDMYDNDLEEDSDDIENYFGDTLTREEMLQELKENNWDDELTEESSNEEILDAYKEMRQEFEDDSDMFPDGRDFDAEDEDGL